MKFILKLLGLFIFSNLTNASQNPFLPPSVDTEILRHRRSPIEVSPRSDDNDSFSQRDAQQRDITFQDICRSLIIPHIHQNFIEISVFDITDRESIEILSRALLNNPHCVLIVSSNIPHSLIPPFFLMQCSFLKSINIGNNFSFIGDNFLNECTSLESIVLSRNIRYISRCFLNGCTSLTSITIQNGITYIRDRFLLGCTSLATVTLPQTLRDIEDDFLFGCTSLTSIALPDDIDSIGESFMDECPNLQFIFVNSDSKTIETLFQMQDHLPQHVRNILFHDVDSQQETTPDPD